MKHLKRYIAMICALCMILGLFSGCGNKKETPEYDANTTYENIDSGIIADNSYYTLTWNKDRAAVAVKSKTTGDIWATTPYNYLNSTTRESFNESNKGLNSSLIIKTRNNGQEFYHYSSTDSIALDMYKSEKIDNGISVLYHFDEVQVDVVVDYYLENNGFKVKVDPKKIVCYGEQQIISVTPAPFMCSTVNTAPGSKDAYCVIPSGSGALLYSDTRSDNSPRTFFSSVYGQDASIDQWEKISNPTSITMPFYGVKSGNSAICAIIEQASETCDISAITGDANIGYSYVDAEYRVLGYSNIYTTSSSRIQYSESTSTNIEPLVVGYYALGKENADYSGIAKCYRDYIIKNGNMTKSQDNSVLTVKLIGSCTEDDLFLGFPKTKNISLTSYEESQTILGELSSMSGGNLISEMYGYGSGGIDGTKIAGGYTLTGVCGGSGKLKDFVEYVNNNSIKTFFNFNTVTYAKSSNGYSFNWDGSVGVSGALSTVRQYNASTRDRITDGVSSVLIKRNLLSEATLKTVKTADKYGITGLCYDTLGSVSYSDYNKKAEYPLRNNISKDVSEIIKNVKSNSKSVMLDGAVSYAAAAADILNSCPTASDESFSIDVDVPLYQIVFQGTKSNSVSAINTAINPRNQFLKAIECGSGLSFTLMANYNTEMRKQYIRNLGATLYSDNKDKIKQYVDESKDYLASVAGAKINSNTIIANNVKKTVFDNGVTVYVNYSEKDFASEAGTVKSLGFLVK